MKEIKKHARVITSPICRGAPTGAIALNFGMLDDIANIITHAKFYVNRFREFGVLTPPILTFSVGLARTTLLQCKHSGKHYRATLTVEFIIVSYRIVSYIRIK